MIMLNREIGILTPQNEGCRFPYLHYICTNLYQGKYENSHPSLPHPTLTINPSISIQIFKCKIPFFNLTVWKEHAKNTGHFSAALAVICFFAGKHFQLAR